jgi:5-hydroxyisourate hydrolase
MGKLTTHILDVRNGKPASGIPISLYRISNSARELLGQFITNADGRTDEVLLEGDHFKVGEYQLEFHIGKYFSDECGGANPPFLNIVPICFGVSDSSAHYHVPLVCSPWTYSTYRGS